MNSNLSLSKNEAWARIAAANPGLAEKATAQANFDTLWGAAPRVCQDAALAANWLARADAMGGVDARAVREVIDLQNAWGGGGQRRRNGFLFAMGAAFGASLAALVILARR